MCSFKRKKALYLDPNRGEKEQSFIDSFTELENNIPFGVWKKDESPDFILCSGNENIGIEVTTLVRKNPGNKASPAAIRRSQENVLNKAKNTAIKAKIFPIEVKVKFKNDFRIIDVNDAAQELYDFVLSKLPEVEKTGHHNDVRTGLEYSDWVQIHYGKINGNQWLYGHRWIRIHMNWMKVDPIAEIEDVIIKKDELHKNYLKKCDSCWLLIGVDEWVAPEAFAISQNTLDHLFETNFERVYFLRNIEGKLWRLKTRVKDI